MESNASHRTVTQEDRGQNTQRNDDVAYQPMGTHKTNEEMKEIIDQGQGHYDEQGFYILGDGSFYDPYGYYFDHEGYDEYQGYYDDDGYYVPGPGFEDEYYEKYQSELIVPESLQQEAERLAPFTEHVQPAIEWLHRQEEGKKLVVQIKNIAIGVKENQLKSYLGKLIEDLADKGKLTYLPDERYKAPGVAYFSTADKQTLEKLLRLHKKSYAGQKIRTFLMGYAYDLEEENDDKYDNFKAEKMLDKHADEDSEDYEDYDDEEPVPKSVPAKVSTTEQKPQASTGGNEDEEYQVTKKTKKKE